MREKLTDDKLRFLAIEVVEGRVFGSWMLPQGQMHLLAKVFMPLGVGGANLLPEDASCLYEHMDNRMPLAIDGYPVFSSMHYLTHDEREGLARHVEEYQAVKRAFVTPVNGPGAADSIISPKGRDADG